MKLGADGVILTNDKAKLFNIYFGFLLSEDVIELANTLLKKMTRGTQY